MLLDPSQPEFEIPGIIGQSQAMLDVYDMTRRAAQSNAAVLLLGETGTGKELIATALHRHSHRNGGPFVRVNCGALTESLLESELFGHVKGSFTDAVRDRTGRFEAAHGGTIFLDEINSTSSTLQVKLLRVLQEKEFERVGDTKTVTVDTRVVAASNRDLSKEITEGRFREDLFWRLNVLPIHLPPLRRRPEDIPLLVQHFLKIYSDANQRNVNEVDTEAMQAMSTYSWPGNVRELQNYIERSVVLCDGDTLVPDLLPRCVMGDSPKTDAAVFRGADDESLIQEIVYNGIRKSGKPPSQLMKQILMPVEKELMSQVLTMCNWNQSNASDLLGINRNTLLKKMKECGLKRDKSEESPVKEDPV
ncbi:MAG: sigma-54 dependent transcriptional regulator [Planctomycetota bacterium]